MGRKYNAGDVIEHEGKSYKLSDRKAEVGEKVIITEKIDGDMRDMTIGKTYVVVETGHNETFYPYVNVIDDEGYEASADDRGYTVLEPIKTVIADDTQSQSVKVTVTIGADTLTIEGQPEDVAKAYVLIADKGEN